MTKATRATLVGGGRNKGESWSIVSQGAAKGGKMPTERCEICGAEQSEKICSTCKAKAQAADETKAAESKAENEEKKTGKPGEGKEPDEKTGEGEETGEGQENEGDEGRKRGGRGRHG